MSIIFSGNFELQIARGLVSGITGVSQFGHAPNGVQITLTDIWGRADATPTQQIWLAPTAARIHAIVSSSANDSSAGTGARTVRISGLTTWGTAETSETVTLNGTTNVNTVSSYVIINRMLVLTSGSASINAGTITATAATDNTITAVMLVGVGRSQAAIYGVPSTQTLYIKRFACFLNDGAASSRTDVQIRINPNPDVQTLNFVNRRDILLSNSGSSAVNINLDILGSSAGPCIVKVQGIANTADIDLSAGFDGYLVTN